MNRLIALTSTILGVAVLAGAPGAFSGVTAGNKLRAHQESALGRLLVPGDRVVIAYTLDSRVKSPTGVLYLRNDLRRRFQGLPMRLEGRPLKGGAKFSRLVPARLLRGRKLFYYAVIRDPRSGRSVTLPRRSAWVLRKPVVVKLGTHRFGETRPPDAVVAHAGANEVGWDIGDEFNLGPQTFQVAADGSVWLQDSYHNRLLVWNPGRPDHFARAVPLPGFAGSGDFAFGRDGTVYATSPGFLGYDPLLLHLSSTGKVLWSAPLPTALKGVSQLPLRLGPDGAVYCAVNWVEFGRPSGDQGWMPVATPTGGALSVAAQLRRTIWGYEPLAGGRRLVSAVYIPPRSEKGARDVRYALIGRTGRVLRGWRILSRTEIAPAGPPFFTPELAGGDPVVDLEVARPGQLEHVVLRLGPHGTRARFSLAYRVFGQGSYYADLRVGPGGMLYQLATSSTTGVAIDRYSLG